VSRGRKKLHLPLCPHRHLLQRAEKARHLRHRVRENADRTRTHGLSRVIDVVQVVQVVQVDLAGQAARGDTEDQRDRKAVVAEIATVIVETCSRV